MNTKDARLEIRIDSQLKKQAEEALKKKGITVSEYLRRSLHRAAKQK